MVPLQNLKMFKFEAAKSVHERNFNSQIEDVVHDIVLIKKNNPNSQFGTNNWTSQSLIEKGFPNSIKNQR